MSQFDDYQEPNPDDQFGRDYYGPYEEHPVDRETCQWAMALHLSQFAGYLVPIAGLLAPVLIWQLKRDTLPGIDAHGRNVVNWILSELVYGLICLLLFFVVIGVPLLFLLIGLGVVFPIVGAIKASDGVAWRYPMSFTFF